MKINDDRLLTTREAAEYLRISPYYLRNMRQFMHEHEGPEYQELKGPNGLTCYYTKDQLDKWNSNHKRKSNKRKIS